LAPGVRQDNGVRPGPSYGPRIPICHRARKAQAGIQPGSGFLIRPTAGPSSTELIPRNAPRGVLTGGGKWYRGLTKPGTESLNPSPSSGESMQTRSALVGPIEDARRTPPWSALQPLPAGGRSWRLERASNSWIRSNSAPRLRDDRNARPPVTRHRHPGGQITMRGPRAAAAWC